MSRQVTPASPCQNCKSLALCDEVHPPPRFHSGWECSNCGEIRWGGVLSAPGPLLIGYVFSGGSVLCWRCHRLNCTAHNMESSLKPSLNASNYPDLPYLSGFMTTLWSDSKEPLDRCCDNCGNLVDQNC